MKHSRTRKICAVVFALALLTSGAGYVGAQGSWETSHSLGCHSV